MSNEHQFTRHEIKQHLIENKYSSEALFQLFVIQKRSHFFQQRAHGPVEEMQLRSAIARSTNLTLNEVFIVGSAQIGFSIKPSAPLRNFDELFKKTQKRDDRSDIDIAIVSPRYFEKLHNEVKKFTDNFSTDWPNNSRYSTNESMSHWPVQRTDSNFYHYLARHWFRPDLTPDGFKLDHSATISDWQRKLDRKIAIGIYQNWESLKNYQIVAFDKLKQFALQGRI